MTTNPNPPPGFRRPHIHTQPLLGAVCAHLPDSALALWWLGPGSTNVYIGACMDAPTRLPMGYHRVTNPRFDYASTKPEFLRIVTEFAGWKGIRHG